jgi:GntR family transcriptional regulator, transcriptional repressor for pyruvate dehydrogenase complex
MRRNLTGLESEESAPVLSLLTFERRDPHRSHEYVAEQLRRAITLKLILPGNRFPSERELAQTFGVGRATVQRAVHLLDLEGLVERRRGRNGGTFVVAPSNHPAWTDQLLTRVRENRNEIQEILDFRLALEPAVAARAASVREPSDLVQLQQNVAQAAATTDDDDFTKLDAQFHMTIARATYNRFFLEGVERIRLILNDPLLVLPASSLWQKRTLSEHERIYAAIESADSDTAWSAIHDHIQHTDSSIRALFKML